MIPRPFRRAHMALMGAILLLSGPALAQPVAYTTSVTGVDGELRQAIIDSTTLVALEEEPAPPLLALIRRAEDDVDRVTRALRAFGHYLGTVEITIAGLPLRDPDLAAVLEGMQDPVEVVVTAEPGPQFVIASVDLLNAADETAALPEAIAPTGFGIDIGEPARSDAILAAEASLARRMRALGYPFAQVPDRRAVVDFDTRTMDIAFLLEFGPRADFGAIAFEGLDQVERDLLLGLAPFERGDAYDPEQLVAYRSALTDLGVFNSVRVRGGEALDAEGRLPVLVTVSERKRRFIGFGVNYATSEGFGVNGFWGHRNLFGRAERLRLGAEVARIGENSADELDYAGTLSFRKPAFLLPEQEFRFDIDVRDENLDSFERNGIIVTAGVERRLSDTLTANAGLSYEYERVIDNVVTTDRFTYVGVPLNLRWDRTDDLLNPTEGARITFGITPFFEVLGSSQDLLRARAIGSAYHDFGTEGDTVLAGLVGLGALTGESLLDISAAKRFYAGGGGTVRGYDFQSIGPLDADDDPIGGRSLFHFSLELRQRVFGDFSLVPFVDGGTVFESEFPDFDEEVRLGAGLGIRYATGIGPLRFDVATPINGRDRDDDVAFYISLGQAF